MRKIVYIIGLSHSGSTILDLLLGAHPKMLGLGEIRHLLMGKKTSLEGVKDVCSCGQLLKNCIFWKDYDSHTKENNHKNYISKYKGVLKLLSDKYGDDIIAVDSTKQISALAELLKSQEFDIKVIFILRDVRGWTFSMKSKKEVGLKNKIIASNMYLWFQDNLKIKKFLDKEGVSYIQIGYEELCFQTEYILKAICNFIGIEFDKEMIKLDKSKSHIVFGNRMKVDREKKANILYDNKWFLSYPINFFYFLLFPIAKWNEKNVYLNIEKNS